MLAWQIEETAKRWTEAISSEIVSSETTSSETCQRQVHGADVTHQREQPRCAFSLLLKVRSLALVPATAVLPGAGFGGATKTRLLLLVYYLCVYSAGYAAKDKPCKIHHWRTILRGTKN